MPGLAGSDGSPLVAWPFVVKFLVPPRRPPAVCGPRCHHPPPRAPPRNYARMPCAPRSSTAFSATFHHPERKPSLSCAFQIQLASICFDAPSLPSLSLSSFAYCFARLHFAFIYISFARDFLRLSLNRWHFGFSWLQDVEF